jgi:hypothetical protein
MELLSRDRTICGGLFAAQRVRNRRLSKPNTVVIRRAGYGALGRLDRVRGVRFLRLTRRAADGPAQPEMTQSRHDTATASHLNRAAPYPFFSANLRRAGERPQPVRAWDL